MNNQLVSVIVTTKNEEKNIGRLLCSIKKQTHFPIEIIVVDNNSTDGTRRIAHQFTRKLYNYGPERSAQRNYGVIKSTGKFFLFLDADMELSREVIRDCVDVASKERLIGAVVIPEQSIAKAFWEKVKAFERSFYNENGDDLTDAARFFKREAFGEVEGYDETITGPEDWDLPESIKKLGYKIGRVKSVIYHYERIHSPFSLARKKFYYALKAHRYLSKQSISTFSPKTIYFLRPVFYKNFDKILTHPILSISMFIMLTIELIGGGLGYIIGRIKEI